MPAVLFAHRWSTCPWFTGSLSCYVNALTLPLQAYVDLLCREVAATQPAGGAPLRTVFFGGGTPSLVPPPQVPSAPLPPQH